MRRLPGRLRRSLLLRVALTVLVAETLLSQLGSIPYQILVGRLYPMTIEGNAVADAAAAALVAGPDGGMALRDTPALRRLREGNPSLRVAVFDATRQQGVAGSDKVLSALYDTARGSGVVLSRLDVEEATALGRDVAIVSYADTWQWRNFPAAAINLIVTLAPTLALVGAFVAGITVMVVRASLRPLRDAARLLDVPAGAAAGAAPLVPAEIAPFLHTAREALRVVESEMARQQRFIANAAHELRTPLSILSGRVDAVTDAEVRTAITADIDGMNRVVAQLLTLMRLGHRDIARDEPIDVGLRVRQLAADFAPVAIAAGRDLAVQVTGAPRMLGNAMAFDSAVRNVIANALRAEPAGGTVEISVGPGATVAVADHGPGIPEAMRDKVFEPFWRGDEISPGSGLGLAIVRDAVGLHGGVLRIEATPGGGATVRMGFEPDRLM